MSYELLNLFITKLCMVMHHHEPECLLKILVCCLPSRWRSQWRFIYTFCMFWTADPFATKLVWWHIIIVSWIFLWVDWIAMLCSRSRSQEMFQISMNVHLDNISSTAEPFVIKLGMVMHNHGSECCARRLVYFLQLFKVKVTVRGSYFLQPNVIGWYIIISWSVLCRNWIVVFKVKVTVKVQNFI